MPAKTKLSDQNYLDFIPCKNPDFMWGERDNGLVTVTVPHTGFFDRFVQKMFGKPSHSRIDLDVYGSYIWGLIDGSRSIFDISEHVHEKFGDEAEPLLNRLVAFFRILKEHKFIIWKDTESC